jgi:hypothetical protein
MTITEQPGVYTTKQQHSNAIALVPYSACKLNINLLTAGKLLTQPSALWFARCLQDRLPPVWLQLLQVCTHSEECGQQARQRLAACTAHDSGEQAEAVCHSVVWHSG